MKLLELAKKWEAKVVTNDFNLNKVAHLHHVEVLNINDLANALKPVVLPGERMTVLILKEGKEYNPVSYTHLRNSSSQVTVMVRPSQFGLVTFHFSRRISPCLLSFHSSLRPVLSAFIGANHQYQSWFYPRRKPTMTRERM